MTAQSLETLLARLYTDDALRREFSQDPGRIARAAGLDESQVAELARVDPEALSLAAHSFAAKRAAYARRPAARQGLLARWQSWLLSWSKR